MFDFFFPKRCVYCHLYRNSFLCAQCKTLLIPYTPECYITRQSNTDWQVSASHTSPLEKIIYLYTLQEPLLDLITSIKYSFYFNHTETLFELLLDHPEFKNINFQHWDIITYVPLTKFRERWRGFNQSKLIAQMLARHLNKPYCQILYKKRRTKNQAELDKKARKSNLINAFKLKSNIPIQLKSQNILIIDDVCTTGSTLEECANTIINNFPQIKVSALCIARGE